MNEATRRQEDIKPVFWVLMKRLLGSLVIKDKIEAVKWREHFIVKKQPEVIWLNNRISSFALIFENNTSVANLINI